MSQHSMTEASAHLPDLIERALAGDQVVITRDGQPVARLEPLRPPRSPGPVTAADVEWLRANLPQRLPLAEDSGSYVSQMRDEEQR